MKDWQTDLGHLLELAGEHQAALPWLAPAHYEDAYEPRAQRTWTPSGDFTWQLTVENDYALTGNQLWDLPEASPVDLPFTRGWLLGEDRMVAYDGSYWQLWDLSRQLPGRRFSVHPDIRYLSEVWGLDRHLAVWQNEQILFFDLGDGSLSWQIEGYKITQWLPERQAVIINRSKRPSGLYRLQDGAELTTLPHSPTAFASDQRGYALGAPQADWSYHAWEDGRTLASAQNGPGEYPVWLHLPGREQLLVADSGLTRWSLQDGCLLQDFGARLHSYAGQNVTLSRDGRLILAVCVDGLAVYSSADGRLLQFFGSPDPGQCRVEVSPDDRWLVCCLGNRVHFYERVRANPPLGDAPRLLGQAWPEVRPYRSQCVFTLSRRHPELRPLTIDRQPYRDHREWIWAAVCQRRWNELWHYPPSRIWNTLLECPDDAPLLELLHQQVPFEWCRNLALRLVENPRPGLVAGLRLQAWAPHWLPLLDWLEGQPAGDLRPLLEELPAQQADSLRIQLSQRQELSLINRWDSALVGQFSPADWAQLLPRLEPAQLRAMLPRLPLHRSLPLLKDWPGPWEPLLQSAQGALQPALLAEPLLKRHEDQVLLCQGRVDFGLVTSSKCSLFYERQWRDWPGLRGLAVDPRGQGMLLVSRQSLEYWSLDLCQKIWSQPLDNAVNQVDFYFPPNQGIAVLTGRRSGQQELSFYRRQDGFLRWSSQVTNFMGGGLQVDERGAFLEYRWLDWRDGQPRPIPKRNAYWSLRGQPCHLYVRTQACSPNGNWWAAANATGEVVLSRDRDRPMRYYQAPAASGHTSLLVDDRHSLLGSGGDFWEAQSGELLLGLREPWLTHFAYEGRRSRLAAASHDSLSIWRLVDPRPLDQMSAREIQERLAWAYRPDEQALWTIAAQLHKELP